MYRVKFKVKVKWLAEFVRIVYIQVVVEKDDFGRLKYSVQGRVAGEVFCPTISPLFDTVEEALDFAERVEKAYPSDDDKNEWGFDCIKNFPEFDIKLI